MIGTSAANSSLMPGLLNSNQFHTIVFCWTFFTVSHGSTTLL